MYFIPWKLLNFIIHLLYIISLLQDYNGSQLWDTSFVVQAIISTNLGEEYGLTLRKAHQFIKNSQVHVAIEV